MTMHGCGWDVANIDSILESFPNTEFIDVRELEESPVPLSNTKNWRNLPMSRLNPEVELSREVPIVFICASGIRTAHLVIYLRQHGWENVYSLLGGVQGRQ